MENADFISGFWEKEQKEFNKNLTALKKHPDKKAAHDLRVAVKKLRAALKLYLLISESPLPETLFIESEQLFTITGKQRDIEICLEIINKYQKETGKIYPALKSFFHSVLIIAHKWTSKAVKQYKKNELAEIAILLKDETQIIDLDALKHKIAGIINSHLADCRNYYKKPHKLRQSLKEIYYWIKMIPETLLPRFEYEKKLHDLLDDFGNWQNLIVFEIKLKHFRKDYLPDISDEYHSIKVLETEVKEKKEKLLKVAKNKTSKLLKKATESEKRNIS